MFGDFYSMKSRSVQSQRQHRLLPTPPQQWWCIIRQVAVTFLLSYCRVRCTSDAFELSFIATQRPTHSPVSSFRTKLQRQQQQHLTNDDHFRKYHGWEMVGSYRSITPLLLSSNPNKIENKDTNAVSLSNEEIGRYSRHLVLSNVAMTGQLKLKQAAVLVIGAGGLGSPVLLYCAAAGVGHIGIVDADVVDVSNLQRQIIHNVHTVTTSKCQSARQAILQLNPNVNVRIYEEEFTVQTAPRIISDGFAPNVPWTIVIDGSDNFPTKYLINDICAIHGLPWIYSAILGFEGQVSVFNVALSGNDESHNDDINRSPDYRDLLPTPPLPGDVPSCAEGGVLGILPGTMGCIQATEAIKYILNFNDDGLLMGRVLCYNALTMKFTEIKLQRNKDRVPIAELIDYQGFCGGPKATTTTNTSQAITPQTVNGGTGRTMDEGESLPTINAGFVHDITPKECCSKLLNGWTPYVIDVRLDTEHDIVHLPFTDCVVTYRNIKVSDVPIDGDVLLYCKGGVRGTKAGTALINAGIDPRRIYNLKGGIMQWQKDIDPSMPRY